MAKDSDNHDEQKKYARRAGEILAQAAQKKISELKKKDRGPELEFNAKQKEQAEIDFEINRIQILAGQILAASDGKNISRINILLAELKKSAAAGQKDKFTVLKNSLQKQLTENEQQIARQNPLWKKLL